MAAVSNVVSQAKLRVERARARYSSVDVAVRVLRRYSEDDGGLLAAALTYFTFFSIFPLMLFAASAVGYLSFLSDSVRQNLLDSGLEAFPLLGSVLDVDSLTTLQERRGALAAIGLVMALYSGSGAIVALEHALNKINRNTDEGSFLKKRLKSLKWLAALGGAAIVSVALGTAAAYPGALLGLKGTFAATLGGIVGHLGSFALGLGIFLTAFKLLPAGERAWREVLPGAVIAAAAFEVLKIAGPWYLERGGASRSATFGAFAAAAGLLVASYLLAQVTLLAGEVNAVLSERRRIRGPASK